MEISEHVPSGGDTFFQPHALVFITLPLGQGVFSRCHLFIQGIFVLNEPNVFFWFFFKVDETLHQLFNMSHRWSHIYRCHADNWHMFLLMSMLWPMQIKTQRVSSKG